MCSNKNNNTTHTQWRSAVQSPMFAASDIGHRVLADVCGLDLLDAAHEVGDVSRVKNLLLSVGFKDVEVHKLTIINSWLTFRLMHRWQYARNDA